ncbi:MAG: acyl-CoA/acyl-ACP dehydrogenase [Spirochaetes bacterium]|nr:acyl-CoA/acyl-ACP dehydrogenase [Spirochaetota bacterium]
MNDAMTRADALSAEREAFADLAKELSLKKLVEKREEHDRYPFGELFTDAIRDAGTVGFFGINLPEARGGVGMNTGMVAAILDAMSEYDASLAGIIFTNAAALEMLAAASANTGETAAYGVIESLGTVPLAFPVFTGPGECELPVADAGHASITGKVGYLVLGGVADYAVIPARQMDAKGCSYYLVNLKGNLIEKSAPIVSLGLHACPAVDITLKGAPARLIGTAGEGERYFRVMRDRMAVCSAAISCGIMRGSFRDALRYAADRYQGGRQIIDWGQVRMMLANMAIEMKVAESLVETARREMDDRAPGWEMTGQAAAIHAGEMATRSCADGVQLFGGNGYMRDYPQEKRMRDAKQVQCLLGMLPLRKMDYIARVIAGNE